MRRRKRRLPRIAEAGIEEWVKFQAPPLVDGALFSADCARRIESGDLPAATHEVHIYMTERQKAWQDDMDARVEERINEIKEMARADHAAAAEKEAQND